ncbi:hypothetical protein [Actomonas aquatica]|uniref:Uncharacterized protein n=1 Tax=Actomonas aquatica TaxID=2866162 RepID=A0ABZ1CAK6_9BACT|nr:hypothetical protein [Opitutus sp. WL0086]WRQ88708.1 hypothetical protein K1X11_004780 [Opitutus sp. WL0086]
MTRSTYTFRGFHALLLLLSALVPHPMLAQQLRTQRESIGRVGQHHLLEAQTTALPTCCAHTKPTPAEHSLTQSAI